MAKYIALLRAVNVAGTGKLPMAKLEAMCVDGFTGVKTYIASGNVIFASATKPAKEMKPASAKSMSTMAREWPAPGCEFPPPNPARCET